MGDRDRRRTGFTTVDRRMMWLGRLALAVVVYAGACASAWAETRAAAAARLGAVKAWAYQLQNYDAEQLASLAASDTDLLVLDYQRADGVTFSAAEIAALKRRHDGGRRLVVAYLSIGEAEEYRFYWKPQWSLDKPPFIISENCRWPTNHLVRFWQPQWRDIMFRTRDSYLAQILDAGFDGVYLDRVDVHNDIKRLYPAAGRGMIRLVAELAAAARARRPAFLVIAQNAEELLADAAYRAVIDAVAKEDLLHGVFGTGQRNPPAMIEGSMTNLRRLSAAGKPVFAVEYLVDAAQIAATRVELATRRIPTVFPTRALDGRDPLSTDRKGRPRHGTPEFAVENCDGVFPKRG